MNIRQEVFWIAVFQASHERTFQTSPPRISCITQRCSSNTDRVCGSVLMHISNINDFLPSRTSLAKSLRPTLSKRSAKHSSSGLNRFSDITWPMSNINRGLWKAYSFGAKKANSQSRIPGVDINRIPHHCYPSNPERCVRSIEGCKHVVISQRQQRTTRQNVSTKQTLAILQKSMIRPPQVCTVDGKGVTRQAHYALQNPRENLTFVPEITVSWDANGTQDADTHNPPA